MTMSEKMIRVSLRMSDSCEGVSAGSTLTGIEPGPDPCSARALAAGREGAGSAGAGRAFTFMEAVADGAAFIPCRGDSISPCLSLLMDEPAVVGMARKTVRQFLQRTGAPPAGRRASSNRYREGSGGAANT